MLKTQKIKLKKEAREKYQKYQNLSEEEKGRKHQYGCDRCRNLSVEEKGRKHQYGCEQYKSLLENEFRKNCFRM